MRAFQHVYLMLGLLGLLALSAPGRRSTGGDIKSIEMRARSALNLPVQGLELGTWELDVQPLNSRDNKDGKPKKKKTNKAKQRSRKKNKAKKKADQMKKEKCKKPGKPRVGSRSLLPRTGESCAQITDNYYHLVQGDGKRSTGTRGVTSGKHLWMYEKGAHSLSHVRLIMGEIEYNYQANAWDVTAVSGELVLARDQDTKWWTGFWGAKCDFRDQKVYRVNHETGYGSSRFDGAWFYIGPAKDDITLDDFLQIGDRVLAQNDKYNLFWHNCRDFGQQWADQCRA